MIFLFTGSSPQSHRRRPSHRRRGSQATARRRRREGRNWRRNRHYPSVNRSWRPYSKPCLKTYSPQQEQYKLNTHRLFWMLNEQLFSTQNTDGSFTPPPHATKRGCNTCLAHCNLWNITNYSTQAGIINTA